MSFLKIGDRAAGAIKSGGTTRRAAKMVIVDVDHPDIEKFINWKVKEEQKVAALMTGSIMCERRLKEIMQACRIAGPDDEERYDQARNSTLARAIKNASSDAVPVNYIYRVIQFAKQGYDDISFDTYNTQLGLRVLSDGERPECQQFRAGQ